MSRLACLLATALVLAPSPTRAAEEAEAPRGAWLHVRVVDAQGAESVNVNLPVAVLSLALQAGDVQATVDRELAGRRLSAAELRQTWAALRGAGDGDLLVTQDEAEAIRVRLESGNLLVHVTDRATGEPRTTATLPGRVVDALLAGDGDRLDVAAALRNLAAAGVGDVLTATDGVARQTIRVWLD